MKQKWPILIFSALLTAFIVLAGVWGNAQFQQLPSGGVLTAQQAAKGIAPDGWRQEAPGQWHFTFTAGEDLSSLTLCVTNTAAPLEAERLTDLARSGELYALDVTPGETVELVFACRRSPQTWLMSSAFADRAFRFRTLTQLITLTAFVTMGVVVLALYHYKHQPELGYFLLYLVIMSAWALMVFFFPAIRSGPLQLVLRSFFAFTVLACLGDASYWLLHGDAIWFWDQLLNAIPLLCFLGGGAGVLWAGLRKKKQVRTYRNYLAMIGRRQTISISTLASATGASPAKVRDCLEDMLDDGLFPLGFLDYGGDRLVLSGEGLNDPAPAQEEKTEEKKAAPVDEENAVLAEIRAVNDSIEDAALSAQIDRIGVITAKIFEYQKSHPERSAQLHAFLSYYLPTTLKILRAYAQLESQGVEGENIAAAMSRIEGMMGKVVEGFEKQLDQLFQGDAMDITTDVAVLEQMLQKDGLSSSGGMQIGI